MASITKYEGQTLTKQSFVIEECCFMNCVLKECDLFYSGGDVEWMNSPLENCRWHFRRGPTDNTIGGSPWNVEGGTDTTTVPGQWLEDDELTFLDVLAAIVSLPFVTDVHCLIVRLRRDILGP
jgi:hypothetical protein